MASRTKHPHNCRIGFISTRFEGTDGVSLETRKWVRVLESLDYECFFFAGASEWDASRSWIVPEAHFDHPAVEAINNQVFGVRTRPPEVTRQIQLLKDHLKSELYHFIDRFGIGLLVVENALAIPMNIPLGLAITELISETGLPTIGHHHDFFWERKRFLVNSVWDYLNMAFPPHLPSIRHVVINSHAANQLSLRTGVSNMVLPNVMDFDHPPAAPDAYCQDLRQALQMADGEWMFLQPTRVVPRKGIEHAIELTRRIGFRARLVISNASGDEGMDYESYLREYAQILNVSVNFVSDIIQDQRSLSAGHKVYALYDIYPFADLVTYPSDIEGFGNAFLEAVYFRRPIIVNNYSIFNTDIKPKGFEVIEFDSFITDAAVEKTLRVLENPALAQEMTSRNYTLARRHYSFSVLERHLQTLLAECFGEENPHPVDSNPFPSPVPQEKRDEGV